MDNKDIKISSNMNLGAYSPLELTENEVNEEIKEKAVSKSQQRFFGLVRARQKGKLDADEVSKSVNKAAKNMSKKDVKDFAKTKHKGLPNHVDESTLREIIRESLKEISNKAIGRYMRATQGQRRERQYNSGKWHAIETVNKKYSFTTKLEYGEEISFSLGFENGQFMILADVDEHINSKETYTYKLIPEHPRRTIDGAPIAETVVGYAIDNLRAGERMKLNGLCQSAMELNQAFHGEQEHVDESLKEKSVSKAQRGLMGAAYAYKKGETKNVSPKIKKIANSMSKKDLKDFAGTKEKGLPEHVDESIENENIYTMEDWRRDGTLRVQEGQLIAPEVYWQLLESVPPVSNGNIFQPGEAYDHDPNTGRALYRTFKREGDNYYRYIGLKPASGYSLEENLNEISDDTVDSAYMKALADTNKYGYDDPMGVRRRAQAKNIKQMRDDRLGFDPVQMSGKMRQNGTSGDQTIDRKWATWQRNHNDRVAGKRTYDKDKARWITKQLEEKINESVQTELVKVLGKYTEGKATSEQANKAIMNLANSSNNKINESIEDEMKVWNERDKSEFGQILKQLQTIAEDCLIDAGDAMSSIRTVYALDGNEVATVKRVKRCLSEYDIILLDDEGNVDIENSNSPEAAELVYKLSNLAPNGLNESKIDDYQETHFAVNKNTGKIVNGWDYRGYDGEELRQFKRDYFIQDLLDNDLDPKQYVILNKATCIRRGINPDDSSNWANA